MFLAQAQSQWFSDETLKFPENPTIWFLGWAMAPLPPPGHDAPEYEFPILGLREATEPTENDTIANTDTINTICKYETKMGMNLYVGNYLKEELSQ